MSKHIIGNGNSQPYISNCYTPSQAQPGTVWYDSGSQSLMVYDGSTWVTLTPAVPSLTWEAEEAIDHLIELTMNQPRLDEMANKYPMVADALGQLEVALKLCQNLEDNDSATK